MNKNSIDWTKLKETVRLSVRFLDDVIDINKFPLPEIEKMTKSNRKIGLGVMGFADLLIKLNIPYNSSASLKLADQLMSFISKEARKISIELGKEKGSFSNFKNSTLTKFPSMRNATLTTIAPTAGLGLTCPKASLAKESACSI